jgi:DNA-binding NtrC family response regulator
MTPLHAVLDRNEPAPAVPQPAPLSDSRLLVADDHTDVIEAVRLLMTPQGMTVLAAGSPAEALAIAKTTTLDAALIDLNYEKGRTSGDQGLELVSALRRQLPNLPIVVMTAWSSIDLALDAMRRGARDFVEKPWDDARLTTVLRGQAELGHALRRVNELEDEVRQLRGLSPAAEGTAAPSMRLMEMEATLVRKAMETHQGNVSRAARTLGLSRSALYRRLDRHKI